MKKAIIILLVLTSCLSASAQFVAKMEVKEPIPGVCNNKEVYTLFPIKGQEKAVCPVTEDSIQKRLNSEVAFLKGNKDYKDKGMMRVIINCRGEVVQCQMDNKTKSPELDKQMEIIFNTLGSWKAGKLDGKPVDSVILWSFEIKKGTVSLD